MKGSREGLSIYKGRQYRGGGWINISLLKAVQKYCLLLFFLVCPWFDLILFEKKVEAALTHLGSGCAHFGPVMDTQNMHNKTQDVSEQHQTHVVQAKGRSGKKRGGKSFILPEIKTCHWFKVFWTMAYPCLRTMAFPLDLTLPCTNFKAFFLRIL
jgi:hypothetical protein